MQTPTNIVAKQLEKTTNSYFTQYFGQHAGVKHMYKCNIKIPKYNSPK